MNYFDNNEKNFLISNNQKFIKKNCKNCLFRSFSNTNFRKYKIKNGKLSHNNEIPLFFDLTSSKLIDELEQEITFNSELNNKSYDFLQKYSLNLNDKNINNQIYNKNSNIYNGFDNNRKNFWNSDIYLNNYFESGNKGNEYNNYYINSDINHCFSNILNDSNRNNKYIQSKKESLDIEGIYKLKKENIFNSISKTKSQFDSNDLIIENSHFSFKNKYINIYENNKERKNINSDNILTTKQDKIKNINQNIVEFQNGYKYNSIQNKAKGDLSNSIYLHTNKINSIDNSHKFDEFQELNSKQNNVIYTINNKININNDNKIYYNNYINLINPILPNNQKDEALLLNKKNTVNSITNNNDRSVELARQYLDPKDYLIEMYGKLGWFCYICDNFNYEPRKKCNRCKSIKLPKIKEEIYLKRKKTKNVKKMPKDWKVDWFCLNCKNLNYGFRKFCNKCKAKREKISPSIFLEPNQKLKGNEIIHF